MMTKLGSARPTLVWIAVIVALSVWALRDLALLIGYAVLLAYALLPAVGAIERLRFGRGRTLPRGVAAGVVLLALLGLVGALPPLPVPPPPPPAPPFPAPAPPPPPRFPPHAPPS